VPVFFYYVQGFPLLTPQRLRRFASDGVKGAGQMHLPSPFHAAMRRGGVDAEVAAREANNQYGKYCSGIEKQGI
jgi:hypothetical protein